MLSSKPLSLHVQGLELFPEKTIGFRDFNPRKWPLVKEHRHMMFRVLRAFGIFWNHFKKLIHGYNQVEGCDLGRHPAQLRMGDLTGGASQANGY